MIVSCRECTWTGHLVDKQGVMPPCPCCHRRTLRIESRQEEFRNDGSAIRRAFWGAGIVAVLAVVVWAAVKSLT